MCGIAGVFGREDRESVELMLKALSHRGPDDMHMVSGPRFTMGTARLSIVDVEGGRQPLTNEDGTVTASQNGELYNFPVLRPALLERGHQLHTHTDTEVLPHLWEECGVRLPERIDGMFAVAVWDDRRQTGLLARDRMGKKPLYYWEHAGALYYASELKALLALRSFDRRLNFEALHHYLGYKHVPHPLTIFRDVHIVPPAHSLEYRPGSSPHIERYWRLSYAERTGSTRDEGDVVDELIERLKVGVRRRLMSDVPIGFFLSGGLDSSLTTALAAEVAPDRVKTFTLTYGDGSSNEGKERDRQWARWVADRWNTDHHEEQISIADYPSTLRRILQAFDEPFAGVVSTYFLAEAMAKHVKVAIAGDGADELFGSYLSHRMAFPEAAKGVEPDWQWRARLLVMSDEEKYQLYVPDVAIALRQTSTKRHLKEAFASLTAGDPLNRVLEAEFAGIFPDQVLTFVDRLSMAHSLEVRSAFLDTEFVEFAASLPGDLKVRDGDTKYILKQAALRYFPEPMVRRPKEGFLMPITQWMLGDLQPWLRATLSPERLRLHGLFEPARVQELIDRLQEPGADHVAVNRVLALAIFQEWYELYEIADVSSSSDVPAGTQRVTFGLSMLGWALNEEDNIAAYIDRAGAFLRAVTDDYELVLIDDGSTDRTWAIATEAQRTRPWLKTYKNDRNRGSGYNTKRAISLATREYVFWQTVDWSYDIRQLAAALSQLTEVDVLQGVRVGTTSASGLVRQRSDNPYKGLVSVVNYQLIRLLFRLPFGDFQNVTVYPRRLIQGVTLETESSFTNAECLLKTWWRGATYREVPVPFVKRERGVGTGTRPKAIVKAISDIVRWWVRWIVLDQRDARGRGRIVPR